MPPITLTTPRLVLREFRAADFDALRAYESDPQIQRYEAPVPAPEQTRAKLDDYLKANQEEPRARYRLAITVKGSDLVIGRLALSVNIPSIREYEIGWTVRRADWGQGYATEAAREVLRFAFGQLNAHRVVAFCHAQNAASYRVMEKLGMQREGLLRETRWLDGHWADELVYGILEKEFH